jgi:hypothetical protein
MKQIAFLIGFVLLVLAGVAGIPSWPKIETSAGYYSISKNPYGVAIYQDSKYASVQFVNARTYEVKGSTVTIVAPAYIAYSRDDIIFDATGTLYTEPNQDEIDYLSGSLGKQCTKVATSDRIIPLPVRTLYLVNPHIPGLLEFHIPTGLPVRIDRDRKQIGGWTDTTVSVIIHDKISI